MQKGRHVDVLIKGVSSAALARIDGEAAAQGLSRNEYLRRQLEEGATADARVDVTLTDLQRAARAAGDLLDDDVMRGAWA